ncbi:MAG TPA: hypothetical protein VLB73_04505 [Patescibacteria group bacterium]|nr:hypothetical protein [Patescibacteria group bacterium]
MAEYELTPTGETRYDGYMDPSGEQSHNEQSETSSEMSPGPVSEATRSLLERANSDTRETVEPDSAKTNPEPQLAKVAEEEKKTGRTRDKLTKIAQTVQNKANGAEVWADASLVVAAVDALQEGLKPREGKEDTGKKVREELEKAHVFEEAEKLSDEIKSAGAKGALGYAGRVASLASRVAGYFEAAKLTLERDDPFKQITSFEELMGKFNKTQLDPKFRPGGEFSLIDVEDYEDEFGRTLLKETAHPENFLRWVRERAWFYHDFDPMQPIDLFKGMYVVAGSRTVSMYEILVDFDTYFAHRQETFANLRVSEIELGVAEKNKTFVPNDQIKDLRPGESAGYYVLTDQATGKQVKYKAVYAGRGEYGAGMFDVFDEQGNPVQAVLEEKEEWNKADSQQKISKEFEEAKTQIMYEIWLLTKNHNMDVAYRQKGMVSEKPLSETLAELYSENIWTRTRSRILKMFNMPTTTHTDDLDSDNETVKMMEGELGQGSTGKAFQRSLAAYYHIAEANAAYNKYAIEGDNPFYKLMEKRDSEGKLLVDGADVFYRALIRRTLEDKKFNEGGLSNKYDEKAPEKSTIAAEFIHELNTTRIPRRGKMEGTSRKRYEWEKADLADFLMLSKNDFLAKMQKGRNRFITQADLDTAATAIKAKYPTVNKDGSQNDSNQERLRQLDMLLAAFAGNDSRTRTENFLNSLRGKSGIGDKAYGKDGFIYKFQNGEFGKRELDNLSGLAIGLFAQAFPKEYTDDINPFKQIRYSLEARDRMRDAMRDALMLTERLDDFEAKYAEEWAYTFTFHSGISARNDMLGIGHDAWSKVQNTEWYRLRQSGGGNYPGNLDNLYGIHRLGTDMWQGLKVQLDGETGYDRTLYQMLTGLERHGDEYSFNINKDIESFEFAGNAMRQFYADHVSHAIELFIDLTSKQELSLDKLIEKRDNFGRLIWNNEAMQKMIDSTWKHLRYGFDNNGFLYDTMQYGWLYDETISNDVSKRGQVKRTPKFGFMTLRESMFSEKVREMNMYTREDNSSWSGEDVYHTKMARNVFAYLIAAQLREHTRFSGGYRIYSAEEVEVITEAFLKYASRVMQGKDGETIVLSGFFNAEEIMRILVAAHAVLWQLYLKEFGISMGGGFLFGFFDAFGLIMKQLGAGIKL